MLRALVRVLIYGSTHEVVVPFAQSPPNLIGAAAVSCFLCLSLGRLVRALVLLRLSLTSTSRPASSEVARLGRATLLFCLLAVLCNPARGHVAHVGVEGHVPPTASRTPSSGGSPHLPASWPPSATVEPSSDGLAGKATTVAQQLGLMTVESGQKTLQATSDSPVPFARTFPLEGVVILDGASTTQACVRDPSAVSFEGVAIAAQCCDGSTCKRRTSNSDKDCVAGKWNNSFKYTTYLEAETRCAELGYTLCSQSCTGKGCGYNSIWVWTSLRCSLPSLLHQQQSPPLHRRRLSESPHPPLPSGSQWVESGRGTLQESYESAASGGELVLAEGIFTGSGSAVLHVSGKNVTIRAFTPGNTTLDGEDARGVVYVEAGSFLTVLGLVITRGSARQASARL